jgi:molybdopterin synthase catalytic subunit
VSAFGSAVDALGWPNKTFELPHGTSITQLLEHLSRESPRVAAAQTRLKFAVNHQYATPETMLRSGDEVAIIPPVSGGAIPAARLVREPIDMVALRREVESESVGAVVTFAGTVRQETSAVGQPLKALEYSAEEVLALSEMGRLCDEAQKSYEVHKAVLVHRLGTLRTGEISIAAAVSAPHRDAAFECCRFLIEGLKKSAPIFKKEIWHDGSATWVDGV